MSGFLKPSRVGPWAENGATVSSATDSVCLVSTAPTVMTYGSSAGLSIEPIPGPRFPAETTTVIPAFQVCSTAKSRGSMAYRWVESVPNDRFRTRMLNCALWAMTHCRAAMITDTSVAPS